MDTDQIFFTPGSNQYTIGQEWHTDKNKNVLPVLNELALALSSQNLDISKVHICEVGQSALVEVLRQNLPQIKIITNDISADVPSPGIVHYKADSNDLLRLHPSLEKNFDAVFSEYGLLWYAWRHANAGLMKEPFELRTDTIIDEINRLKSFLKVGGILFIDDYDLEYTNTPSTIASLQAYLQEIKFIPNLPQDEVDTLFIKLDLHRYYIETPGFRAYRLITKHSLSLHSLQANAEL
ncbi:hypothetical protein KC669_01425 [Candidatus Dojkabacteria bacterium]|uniref:Uncharacterized protein n=1 Tax=Candidatus Dojkabacteria bacterium TaxID=2099670 RepID=A0A955L9P9_9BACT|nr:hypothetical protein [Candidatus Dojkabacteria bacterium]